MKTMVSQLNNESRERLEEAIGRLKGNSDFNEIATLIEYCSAVAKNDLVNSMKDDFSRIQGKAQVLSDLNDLLKS